MNEKEYYLELIAKMFSDSFNEYANHPEDYEEEYQAIKQTIPQGDQIPRKAPLSCMIIGFCLGVAQGMELCDMMQTMKPAES